MSRFYSLLWEYHYKNTAEKTFRMQPGNLIQEYDTIGQLSWYVRSLKSAEAM